MLEPVSRSAAYKPNVLYFRMPVDQEITIPSVFVLANTRLHNGRAAQRRKSLLDKTPRLIRSFEARQTRLRVRIDPPAMPVHRNLQPAALQIRHPINFVLLEQPRRQRRWSKARVPRRHAKEKHFLPGRKNPLTQNFR